jgi:HAMP domain-containing protein
MTLRTRLLLGYGYLVLLLLISSGSAATGFLHLSQGIDVILSENFESVHAAMVMLESLERQDSGTLARLMAPGSSSQELDQSEETFRNALGRLEQNITIEGEQDLIHRIEASYETYRKARDRLFASRPEKLLAAYKTTTFPSFENVKNVVFELLEMNHKAMLMADKDARRTAVRYGVLLGALVVLALVSLVLLSRWLQGNLLTRLTDLRTAAEAVAAGDARRRLSTERDDELDTVAKRFNEVLDNQDSLQRRMQGVVSQYRQLTLGLMGTLGPGALLLDLHGRLIAARDEVASNAVESSIRNWIQTTGKVLLEQYHQGDPPPQAAIGLDETSRVQLLVAHDQRPVGWLLRPSRSSDANPAGVHADNDQDAG